MNKLELMRALAAVSDDEEVKVGDLDITGVEIRQDAGIYAVLLTGDQTKAALEQLIARKAAEIDTLSADLAERQASIDKIEAEKAAAEKALGEADQGITTADAIRKG